MFIEVDISPKVELKVELDAPYIFDYKIADVTGDQVDDFIYLAGNKKSPDAIYQEDLSIFVIDGVTSVVTEQVLDLAGGYSGSLFLGDFNQDKIDDIYVSFSSGGSGNIHYYYIYSFNTHEGVQLFNYQDFNELYEWSISFRDNYEVLVQNNTTKHVYTLNLLTKEPDLLERYYTTDGKVKDHLSGEVLPLGDLSPILISSEQEAYQLLASQRIIGMATVDTLGVIEIYLMYQEGQFIPYEIVVGEQTILK